MVIEGRSSIFLILDRDSFFKSVVNNVSFYLIIPNIISAPLWTVTGPTLDKCPLNVLLVLICIRPIGSMLPVAWARLVSQAAFLPSLMEFLRCSASWRSCSSSFMVLSVCY